MKKLWFPVLLLALFMTSCAVVPKTPISLTSVKPAELQGTWEGQRTMPFDRFVFRDLVVLEIQSAGPPFKGKMTIYSSPRWDPGQNIKVYSFDRGQMPRRLFADALLDQLRRLVPLEAGEFFTAPSFG